MWVAVNFIVRISSEVSFHALSMKTKGVVGTDISAHTNKTDSSKPGWLPETRFPTMMICLVLPQIREGQDGIKVARFFYKYFN